MRVLLENSEYTLDLTVSNGVDFDSIFAAYDNNEKEKIFVKGWMFEIKQLDKSN